jgi:hypothetical protein
MHPARPICCLCAVLILAACDDQNGVTDPQLALSISSVSPADDATGVEAGAAITVVFSEEIDPLTLTPANFKVTRNGAALATALTYDPATSTVRAAAPLLPGVAYQVEVTPAVRTPDGSGLSANRVWTFTTRAGQPIEVETGVAGINSSLALGGSGRVHIAYDAAQGLKFGTCAAACDATASWQTVGLDTVTIRTSLDVDASGRVHVAYDRSGNALKYATCAAGCEASASWDTVTVDPATMGRASLTVEPNGRVHVTYRASQSDFRYATCDQSCADVGSWQGVTVDDVSVLSSSVAVDASGRVHISYIAAAFVGLLKYATCATDCTAAASWKVTFLDVGGGALASSSLAVDSSGRVHIAFYDELNQDLRYITCEAGCDAAVTSVRVDADGDVGSSTSLAVDAAGRAHVSYYDVTNGRLKYATCAAACVVPEGWQTIALDDIPVFQGSTSLAVAPTGRVHVSYFSSGTEFALKYVE